MSARLYPVKIFPTSEEFNSKTLGMQWGWNHNPDPTKWSLAQRTGLFAFVYGEGGDQSAQMPETLTQRPFTYYSNSISAME